MSLTLEIVPGQSIGPFRLGMTRQEVEQALWSLSPEPLTIDDLGVVAWFPDDENPQPADRCTQLGIRVYNNPHTILLRGQSVNNIGNEEAIALFESFAVRLDHSYGGFDALAAGIQAVRWEDSDPWIDSIFVCVAADRGAYSRAMMKAAVSAQEVERKRRAEQDARQKFADEGDARAKDLPDPGLVRSPGQTVTLKLPGGVPISFAWCPPGTFRMGSAHPAVSKFAREPGERPVHTVTLTKGFFAGTHPVTQVQWHAVMGTAPSRFKGPNRPVETVSWDDCRGFCARFTALLNDRATIRLPTEAEWEYACRADTTTEYHFGDALNTGLANYNGTRTWNGSPEGPYRVETTDVGSFPPNAWGLHDVHGNVWEWCAGGGGIYSEGDQIDPSDNTNADYHVRRGGSWNAAPQDCRAACRNWKSPVSRDNFSGFRVCFHFGAPADGSAGQPSARLIPNESQKLPAKRGCHAHEGGILGGTGR